MMTDYMLTTDRSPLTTSLDRDASTAIHRSSDVERLHQPPLRDDEGRHEERCDEKELSVPDQVQAHLLATKFFVPASSRAVIPRPHVVSLLQKGIQRRVTLVSAAAGSPCWRIGS